MTGLAKMMGQVDCKTFAKKVYDAIDGELPADDLKRMVKHMNGCTPCKDGYELEAAIKLAIAEKIGSEPVPIDLIESIKKKVEELC